MVDFKEEVLAYVDEINKPIEKLRQKVIENLNSEQNVQGLLKHAENDYMKSLSFIDKNTLCNTLNLDLIIWREELQKVTIAAQTVTKRYEQFLAEQ